MEVAEMNMEADEMDMEWDEMEADEMTTEERARIMKDLMAEGMALMFYGEKKELTELELESKAWVETESDVEREICKQHRLSFEFPVIYVDPKEEKEERPRFLRYALGFFDPLSLHELSPEPKKAEMQDFSCNFSREAFSNLSDRLFGVEERNTMKSVYLCLTRPHCSMSWIVVDANEQRVVVSPEGSRRVVSQSCVDDVMRNPKSGFPSQLSILTGYGCAFWGSKVFIAGGKCEGVSSDRVFVYDTILEMWEPLPLCMELKRGDKPTVVIADNTVFVFGGITEDDYPLPNPNVGRWVECYDLLAGCWLPTHGTYPFCDFPKIVSHAVYPKGKQILLWLDCSIVLSCNYQTRHLVEYGGFMSITKGPQWNNKVVVIEDILFWHYHGTIYAHDLLSHSTIPTYTLPRCGFSKVLFRDEVPSSFLAHIGKGKLCLFYQVENHICYFILPLHTSQSPRAMIPLLVPGDSGLLQNSIGWEIMHALEVSPLE